jgi:hypothetical protein
VTRAAWTVLLAAMLAGRSATLVAQEPTPDEAPLAAAACAYLLCIVTRAAGLFPASDGGRLIFEPAGGALLAAAAALAISFGLALETSRAARVTS